MQNVLNGRRCPDGLLPTLHAILLSALIDLRKEVASPSTSSSVHKDDEVSSMASPEVQELYETYV